jgi:hypothetical protein
MCLRAQSQKRKKYPSGPKKKRERLESEWSNIREKTRKFNVGFESSRPP